jgi:hypothetical protein
MEKSLSERLSWTRPGKRKKPLLGKERCEWPEVIW